MSSSAKADWEWVGREYRPFHAVETEAVYDRACARIAELEAEHRYPHMCRDGHPEIGHSTDSERCPVCQLHDEVDAMRARYNEPEAALTERDRMLQWAEESVLRVLLPTLSPTTAKLIRRVFADILSRI